MKSNYADLDEFALHQNSQSWQIASDFLAADLEGS
jgi:hypothetical protein